MTDKQYTAWGKLWRRHKAERAEPIYCRDCRHWSATGTYFHLCSVHNEATQANDSCPEGERLEATT